MPKVGAASPQAWHTDVSSVAACKYSGLCRVGQFPGHSKGWREIQRGESEGVLAGRRDVLTGMG